MPYAKENGKKAPLSQYTVYVAESMVWVMFHYGAEKKLVPEIAFGKAGYMIKNKEYFAFIRIGNSTVNKCSQAAGDGYTDTSNASHFT